VTAHTTEDTVRAGQALGESLQRGMTVSLEGPLGSGKTTFVKGIARALGVRDEVTSPSFTIMTAYAGRIPLYHLDLYRLDRIDEIENLGFDDVVFGDGVTVIEWGEKAGSLLPEDVVEVRIEMASDGSREIDVYGPSVRRDDG